MSGQRWVLRSSIGALAILAAGASFGWGQDAAGRRQGPGRPRPAAGQRISRCHGTARGDRPECAAGQPVDVALSDRGDLARWRRGAVGPGGDQAGPRRGRATGDRLRIPVPRRPGHRHGRDVPGGDELDAVDDRLRGIDPQPVGILLRLSPAALRPAG